MFVHTISMFVDKTGLYTRESTSVMLWGCFVAGASGALSAKYQDVSTQNLVASARRFRKGCR